MKLRNISLGFVSAAFVLVGCSSKDEATEGAEGTRVVFTNAQEELADIRIGRMEYRRLSSVISCTGEIEVPPQGMASVTAPLGGYIVETEMVPGIQVRKGQVLAGLRNPEYLVLQQAYLETSGELKFAGQEYRRQKLLQEQNATAERKMQESESAFAVLTARLAGLRAQLKLIGIDAGNLEKGIIQEEVVLRAPISGYVTAVNHHPGEFVEPREAIFEIVSMDELHLHLNVSEQDIAQVRHGQPIRFSATSDNGEGYDGEVALVSPKRRAEDRSFDVHGHIAGKTPGLKPGMYVKAEIHVSSDSLPAVPLGAVVRHGNESFVVTQEDGDYQSHAVETGLKMDGWVEIVNHHALAQKAIVTHGASRLFAALKRSE